MAIRQYDFVSGIETPSSVGSGTPSVDADFTSWGYQKDHFVQGGAPVADITALKAIAAADRADNDVLFVDSKGLFYQFDSASSATGDDNFIVTPTAGTGRWISLDRYLNIEVGTCKEQTSTPANPAAGYRKFYCKNDGNFYSLASTGAESLLGGGGGGGGGGAVWHPVEGKSPVKFQGTGVEIWQFESAIDQKLALALKVPASYLTGTQIKMFISHYSPSTSNTILLQSRAFLVRKNLDAFSATTNFHDSGNSALTNTVANQYREATLNLTDASGMVNSVAVTAGDILRVELTRGTDTDTDDIRFVPSATEFKTTP